jgi:putative ABC transport system permease protein
MLQLFGIQLDTLTNILLVITCAIIGGVVLLALGNAIFFKIGVRNIPRRRTQMMLIIFALMLSTTLLSSVLAIGDVITAAVQSVAIYNLGNVDETVEGGNGALGFFDDKVYYDLLKRARNYPDITAVGAAMVEQNLLVADENSRQVRSKVTALAIIPGSEQGFGGMQNDTGKGRLRIADLAPDEVYLNHTTAQLLNAHPGDFIYLYSKRWPSQRHGFRVRAIVANGGLTGDTPFILSQIQPFRDIEQRRDDITKVFIANRGGGGVNGVNLSNSVEEEIERWIPRGVHVIAVKQQGVQNSQNAENIFSRIFALFSLFVLAIGLLLIFLIFVLLAAERRVEMGMARAIGVQRRHLVLMFLFEGTVYDLLASFVGLGIGVGVGALLVTFLRPTLARFDFPLLLTFQPHSLIIAYCLGVIFTFCSVAVSSWFVSRMTVVEAIRNLPESGRQTLSLRKLCPLLLKLAKQGSRAIAQGKLNRARHIILEQVPDGLMGVLQVLVQSGLLPLLAGYLLMQLGLEQAEIAFFSLGLTLIVVGGGLLIKTVVEQGVHLLIHKRMQVNRMLAALAGLAIMAYWALPFDALVGLGLPRFHGGLEVFFIAGLMMILGAAWALTANAELVVNPLLKLCSWHPRLRIMARLASAYPLHLRFRTGLSVVMFSLVIFAMTVMVVITNALQNTYANIDVQTGGYDIQAVAYFKPLPAGGGINSVLASHGINPQDFASIGIRSATAVGVIQPNAANPAWHLYPAQVVSGGFLHGLGLHLTARAQGFDSDSAIWHALQSNSHYALIDSSALLYRPNSFFNGPVYDPNAPPPADAGTPIHPPGFDPYYSFSMDGVYQGDTTFQPTPVWVAGVQSSSAIKLTIIGVVDNSDSAHFGIYIPSATYGHTSADPSTPDTQTYYFKVAPGQDKRALSLALGSAFLDYGLETTVLEDAIWQVRGPRILLSNILIGVVGMALLLGVAALAITGTRAVIERRQQIGMLRALGCSRRLVQGAFLCESFFVGCIGSLLGVTLGLILARNIFAVNFFERYQTGLTFSVPWGELGIIVGVAVLASLAAALLPAWQAGRVPPVEALRY